MSVEKPLYGLHAKTSKSVEQIAAIDCNDDANVQYATVVNL